MGERVCVDIHDRVFIEPAELIGKLSQAPPHLIGISAKTDSLFELEELMQSLHESEALGGTPVVLGGIAPTIQYEELLNRFPRALIVRGEGEIPLLELIRHLQGECRLQDVPNLVFRGEDGRLCKNFLTRFPLEEEYAQPTDHFVQEILPTQGDFWLESSRGCSGNCSFCSKAAAHVGNGRHRRFPLARTLERMEHIHRVFGIQRFRFSDEDFLNGDFAGAEEFLSGMGELSFPAKFEIDVSIRDICDRREALWKRMRSAGLHHVFVGIESLSNTQLARYHKGVAVEEIVPAMELLRRLDISCAAGFIPFDPFVTLAELEENFGNLKRTGIIQCVNTPIKFLRLQKKTKLAQEARRADIITGESKNGMEYTYRFADPGVARLTRVLAGTAEVLRRHALKLNYNLRPGTDFHRALPAAMLASLTGKNASMKDMQLDFLMEMLRHPQDETQLSALDSVFRERCVRVYQEIYQESKDLRDPDLRDRVGSICSEFLREVNGAPCT